jgi:hypothetical protein
MKVFNKRYLKQHNIVAGTLGDILAAEERIQAHLVGDSPEGP